MTQSGRTGNVEDKALTVLVLLASLELHVK